jgi:polyisoprenoid-binding protein YceI
MTTTTAAITDLTGSYTLDAAHSRLGFIARHAMVTKVRGQFAEWEGAATIDTANPAASSVNLTIKAASVDTGVADRDAHLAAADFFDAENHPAITFVSTDVQRDGATWAITGDFTIKGVSKSLTIEFTETGTAKDPFGNLRAGFEGEATINRRDWGLDFNVPLDTGGVLVSEKIKLEFDISAIRNA